MKKIQPAYYDEFACLAGDCPFTCCREWKIAVDEKSEKTWKKIPLPSSVQGNAKHGGMLGDLVVTKDGDRVIRLRKDGRCPFLQEDGLCVIVKEYGEKMISHTCHVYPREWHVFEDRIEENLMMGCPEALHLLWKQEHFAWKVAKGSDEGETQGEQRAPLFEENKQEERESPLHSDERLLYIRDYFAEGIQNHSQSIREHLLMMEYVLLDFLSDEKKQALPYIQKILQTKELSPLYEALGKLPTDNLETLIEQNELFLDLAENYRKKGIYRDILEPLAETAEKLEALIEESEKLQENLGDKDETADVNDASDYEFVKTGEKATANSEMNIILSRRKEFEEIWETYEHKLRLLLAEEIYGTLYLPEGDFTSMTMKLQWLSITYAVMKQACFLGFLQEKCVESSKNRISGDKMADDSQNDASESNRIWSDEDDISKYFASILLTILRMTGYTDEDIEEYLTDSFESLIWEWGYMMLIVD